MNFSNKFSLSFNLFQTVLITSFVLSLSACGGGSGSSGESESLSSIQTGVFLDSAVEGLSYSTPTLQGMTNANGEFQYRIGETVTFHLGSLIMGAAKGQKYITPIELLGAARFGDSSDDSYQVAKMVDFFMTLDADQNPNNGIQIPAAFQNISYSADFRELKTDRDDYDLFQLIGLDNNERNRIHNIEAANHFLKTLEFRDTVTGNLANGLVMHMPFTADIKDVVSAETTAYGQEFIEGFALDLSKIDESSLNLTEGNGISANWKESYDTDEFTISFWAKLNPSNTISETEYLFGLTNYKAPASPYGLQSRYLFTKQELHGETTLGVQMTYPAPNEKISAVYVVQNKVDIIEADHWHHFTFTYSKNNKGLVQLFHDGEMNISFNHSRDDSSYQRPNIDLQLKVFAFYPFNGQLDDLRIYNRVLSLDEINQLSTERK